ncbi:hypothetical protein MUY27_17425 [Mucilaginibacter sp. RS28]|uniref:Tetratricopeptide repeat protein n=1 Tax=Mucilaginibacter straminoryzae TaxID=2932774 RepID=A0A9X1XB38_9SPHI|nr:hypothetical protein [Mucilaginibacter straminoryzae]MCJ8211504.1 hypothetical protein [Mucilaginibacter straminoryzae]
MKKFILLTIFTLGVTLSFASTNPVDSLQKIINDSASDSLKADLYNQMANRYMNYGALQDRSLKNMYQENALHYTLSALHHYYKVDDTVGMRRSYERLAVVYHDQKKYTQAKWFILQANTLAREKADATNIINTLVKLAQIKMDIKDYNLAKGDLREALTLASANCFGKEQADVMQAYVQYYTLTGQPLLKKTAAKRYAGLKDSMKRDSAVKQMAKLQTGKKFYTVSNRRDQNTRQTSVSL